MISSIFYFANTEQEYLDNFNNHQVKPYTIVFCKDTHTLWKDGIKYGGDTARTEALISDWVETNITPLINQLQDAMDTASQAADEERRKLDGVIGGINNLIKDEVENMFGDSEWIQENWPQGATQWQSGWNEELESYLTTVGYWDVNPETGVKTTKWSKLEQSVDRIDSSVNRINKNIGTTELLLSSLQQLITNEGTARTELKNLWTQKENDTEKILKWMYSGLTTESGSDKTFADLKAAAQDGETTGISTIGAIVEKVPVIDPQTGDPQLDQDGNIVYQKDSNNNYIYRAKSTFSSALNDSLATMINESTENSATSLVITSVGDCIAALRNEVIDGRGAYASLGAKFAGMEAGLVAKADLNEAVAGLVIDGVRTVKLTVLNSLPSGASYFNTTQQLPSELDQHTKLRYTVSEFTALINTIFVHKQVAPDTWDDVPASYGADLTYDVHPGSYLKCSDDKYLYIEEISFSSSVFSEVDSKIGEAKSGLVAKKELTGEVALILATVGEDGSSITLDADQLTITSDFINAMKAELNVQLLVADEVAATTISANTIDASSSYTVTDENDQSTTYTSHTIVDGDGVRIYNGENGHVYNELTDSSETYTDTNGVIPNVMFNKSGEGWLANGNIAWDTDGEASFTGGIDATSGEISGDLNVTGSLQLGASNNDHIILGSDVGGYLKMYDPEHQYPSCMLGAENSYPILWMTYKTSRNNHHAELRPGDLAISNENAISHVFPEYSRIEAGGDKIIDIGYINGSVTLKAYDELGESAWPNFATASTKPKGQVFAMDLATLKTMLNSSSQTDLQQYAILMTPI